MKDIAVIGSGSWGLALGLLLNEKGHRVTMWCHNAEEKETVLMHRENKRCLPGIKIPLEIDFTVNLKEATLNKEIVILAVPSRAIREMARQMAPFLDKDAIVVNVAKGLEDITFLRLSQVINEELPQSVVVLSGPSHAEEVARHIPTAVTVSGTKTWAVEQIQETFMTETFRVYTNEDLIGVEIGGALKNVIALAAGLIEGVGYGDNTKAALITRGLAEISRLGQALGARAETFSGLTGIGDLIVTCTSGHSRNRRAGELIGQGYTLAEAVQKVNMVVEGVPTTQAAYHLMQKTGIEMPIITAIYHCLFENQPVAEAVKDLMQRDKKTETYSF
jgi:glycerol-3-phosphate dehydrogenase (NAD(P)+)